MVVMSEQLEEVFASFCDNRVPAPWRRRGYNSLKTLASWTHDLVLRIHYIEVRLVHLLEGFENKAKVW